MNMWHCFHQIQLVRLADGFQAFFELQVYPRSFSGDGGMLMLSLLMLQPLQPQSPCGDKYTDGGISIVFHQDRFAQKKNLTSHFDSWLISDWKLSNSITVLKAAEHLRRSKSGFKCQSVWPIENWFLTLGSKLLSAHSMMELLAISEPQGTYP